MPSASPTPAGRRRKTGAVTLRDVARLANVAPITVSRVLNTPAQVSDEVRARVIAAVASTGYVPNLLAGGLSSMKSRMVAVAVPTIAGPVFLETVQSLTEALFDAGYQVMLGQTGYDNARQDAWLSAALGRRPDGIVLTGVEHSVESRRRLITARIPVVETWDLTDDPIDMLVGFSHEEVGRAVAEHLVGRGYRRPAAVAGQDARAERRYGAFALALRARGLPTPPVIRLPTPTALGDGRRALAALVNASRQVDAVFCSSDQLAMGVLLEAHARHIAVPDQLAVVGFGDQEFASDLTPPLSTVRIDGTAIGRQAARCIVEQANSGRSEPRVVDVGFCLQVRDSS